MKISLLDFVFPSVFPPNLKGLHCRLSIRDPTGPSGACLNQYAHKLKIIVDNCRGSHYYSVFGPTAQHHESLCARERRGVGITGTPGENKQGFGHAGCHSLTATEIRRSRTNGLICTGETQESLADTGETEGTYLTIACARHLCFTDG